MEWEDLVRRTGKFEIPTQAIYEAPEAVMDIMGTVLVVRAEHLLMTKAVLYEAYSPRFDVVDDGEDCPVYDVEYDPETGKVTWTRQE